MPRKRDQSFSSDDTGPNKKRQKLTDTRLERKREQDRVAQRAIREKTRNHIANLEELVQTLQSDKESSGRIAKLVAQLDEKNAEINRLRNALNNIVKITNAACDLRATTNLVSGTLLEQGRPEETPSNTPAKEKRHDSISEEVAHTSPALEATHDNSYTCMSFTPPQDEMRNRAITESSATPCPDASPTLPVSTASATSALLAGSPATPEPDESNVISIGQLASSITGDTRLEGRLWYLAGTLLNHILKQPQQPPYSAAFDEDIAIRAVVEGWNTRSSLASEALSFAVLASDVSGKRLGQDASAFLAARPSQRYLDHDPLIEYFAWPSLRERLLFYPRKYATDKFMEALRQNLVFIWGHGTSELYDKSPCTGRYSYSETFLKHMADIRHHTVKPAFFDHFPELRGGHSM